MTLRIVPLSLAIANEFVARHHRHHIPTVGHKFSVGCLDEDRLCGVAIMGRPVARMADDGWTMEVTRCCTDGTRNACSVLYGGRRRTAHAMGFSRITTYTLIEEQGASLRAAGWIEEGVVKGKSWSVPSRPRIDKAPTTDKRRWACTLHPVPAWHPSSESALQSGQIQLFEEFTA